MSFWKAALDLISVERPINLFAEFQLTGFPPTCQNVEALSVQLFDLVEAAVPGPSDRCKVDDLYMITVELDRSPVSVGLWVASTQKWECQINMQYPGARNQRAVAIASTEELGRQIEAHIKSRSDFSSFSWGQPVR